MSLNSNKAAGPDGIYPRVLKELSKELAVPLEIIFRMFCKGLYHPSGLERWARFAHFQKKGDKGSAENYRPVSLTAVACKLMEKFVRDAIMIHLEDNNLLSKYPDGFVKGRSCVSQLLACIDTWTRVLGEGVGWGGGGESWHNIFGFPKSIWHRTSPATTEIIPYGIQGNGSPMDLQFSGR